MSRTLRLCMNGFGGSVTLPDEYFTEAGVPKWHLLNAQFSTPIITWSKPIGGLPVEENVVYQPTKEPLHIGEELQKLREVVACLERRVDETISS
jgi:hypothetical protein